MAEGRREKGAEEKVPTRVAFDLRDGECMVGCVIACVLVDENGNRRFRLIHLGESESWDRIGWLQGALDRERKNLEREWG